MKVFNRFIVEDDAYAEIILYGMKIIASHFITVMVVLICGLLLHSLNMAVIYLSILFLLRRNVGGYHCKTYIGCLLTTTIAFILIALTNRLAIQAVKEILAISFLLYSVIKIYRIKPILNKNRIVSDGTIERSNKKKAKWLSILIIIAIILPFFTNNYVLAQEENNYNIKEAKAIIMENLKSSGLTDDEINGIIERNPITEESIKYGLLTNEQEDNPMLFDSEGDTDITTVNITEKFIKSLG